MDSKPTTKEIRPDSIRGQQDLITGLRYSIKEETSHKAHAGGIKEINTRSTGTSHYTSIPARVCISKRNPPT